MEKKQIGPLIEPVSDILNRPFWSVMIPTYNRVRYLEQALTSVLEQDPGSEFMQIEVVDNCSTNVNVEEIVSKIGKNRVSFYRQSQNIGMFPNWNTCIQRSHGYWIHILHDDDFVLPGFYAKLQESIQQNTYIGAAFCRHFYVDELGNRGSLSAPEKDTPGILPNWLERIAVMCRIQCASIVVNRKIYEKLGGFNTELIHASDWEMWRRIAVHYPVWYENQPLACYRLYTGSDTSRIIKSGANIADIRQSIEICESYLPSTIAKDLSDRAREYYALCGLNIARKSLEIGDSKAAEAQIEQSLKCSQSLKVKQFFWDIFTLKESIYLRKNAQFLIDIASYIERAGLPNNSLKRKIDRESESKIETINQNLPIIVVDGVFFQLYKTGIYRVWKSLLEEWAKNSFGNYILVLDRDGTAPKITGIKYRSVPAYNYSQTDSDRQILQQICNEEKADIFISTYYTTPLSTPSVFMAYDMIPEVMRWNLANPMWREKHNAIRHASAYISISENTARDLVKFFPPLSEKAITVAHCGVESIFSPASKEKVSNFKNKYNITKPYFLLVGASGDYKNPIFFMQAFIKLPNKHEYDIVCTGACALNNLIDGVKIHKLQLADEELALAYSGALALVYPSKYEGFGLPIVEALACGCPVITCPNASIPEVAGTAVIYVKDNDVNGLVNALLEVQQIEVRQSLITAGLSQAKKFSWAKMADIVGAALVEIATNINNARKFTEQIFIQVNRVEQQLQQKTVDSSDFLNLLNGCLNLYEIEPSDESVLSELRQIRQKLADFWLDAESEKLENYYLGNVGKAHQTLAKSGFKNESLTKIEQTLVNELIANLIKGFDDPKAINYRLVAMLYPVDDQPLLEERGEQLPKWIIDDC